MHAYPYCSKSLLLADVRANMMPESKRSWRPITKYTCPFCLGTLQPRRLVLSRFVIFLGVLIFLWGGVFAAALVREYVLHEFGIYANKILAAIVVVIPAIGLLATLYVGKLIVRYEKSGL